MEGRFYVRNCKRCNTFHRTPCHRARICEICKIQKREELSKEMQYRRLGIMPIAIQ